MRSLVRNFRDALRAWIGPCRVPVLGSGAAFGPRESGDWSRDCDFGGVPAASVISMEYLSAVCHYQLKALATDGERLRATVHDDAHVL